MAVGEVPPVATGLAPEVEEDLCLFFLAWLCCLYSSIALWSANNQLCNSYLEIEF